MVSRRPIRHRVGSRIEGRSRGRDSRRPVVEEVDIGVTVRRLIVDVDRDALSCEEVDRVPVDIAKHATGSQSEVGLAHHRGRFRARIVVLEVVRAVGVRRSHTVEIQNHSVVVSCCRSSRDAQVVRATFASPGRVGHDFAVGRRFARIEQRRRVVRSVQERVDVAVGVNEPNVELQDIAIGDIDRVPVVFEVADSSATDIVVAGARLCGVKRHSGCGRVVCVCVVVARGTIDKVELHSVGHVQAREQASLHAVLSGVVHLVVQRLANFVRRVSRCTSFGLEEGRAVVWAEQRDVEVTRDVRIVASLEVDRLQRKNVEAVVVSVGANREVGVITFGKVRDLLRARIVLLELVGAHVRTLRPTEVVVNHADAARREQLHSEAIGVFGQDFDALQTLRRVGVRQDRAGRVANREIDVSEARVGFDVDLNHLVRIGAKLEEVAVVAAHLKAIVVADARHRVERQRNGVHQVVVRLVTIVGARSGGRNIDGDVVVDEVLDDRAANLNGERLAERHAVGELLGAVVFLRRSSRGDELLSVVLKKRDVEVTLLFVVVEGHGDNVAVVRVHFVPVAAEILGTEGRSVHAGAVERRHDTVGFVDRVVVAIAVFWAGDDGSAKADERVFGFFVRRAEREVAELDRGTLVAVGAASAGRRVTRADLTDDITILSVDARVDADGIDTGLVRVTIDVVGATRQADATLRFDADVEWRTLVGVAATGSADSPAHEAFRLANFVLPAGRIVGAFGSLDALVGSVRADVFDLLPFLTRPETAHRVSAWLRFAPLGVAHAFRRRTAVAIAAELAGRRVKLVVAELEVSTRTSDATLDLTNVGRGTYRALAAVCVGAAARSAAFVRANCALSARFVIRACVQLARQVGRLAELVRRAIRRYRACLLLRRANAGASAALTFWAVRAHRTIICFRGVVSTCRNGDRSDRHQHEKLTSF